jgi:hypothetical protein
MTAAADWGTPPVTQEAFDGLVADRDRMISEVAVGLRSPSSPKLAGFRACIDELAAKWPQFVAPQPLPLEVDQ